MLLLFFFSHSLTTLGTLDIFSSTSTNSELLQWNWNRNLTEPVSSCNSAEICVDLYSIPPCTVSRSKTALTHKWLQKHPSGS